MKVGKAIWDDPEAREEYVKTMLWSQEEFREKFYHLEFDELPDHVKLNMERRPRKGVLIRETTVVERTWALGDTYLVIPEIQVMNIGGFHQGDRVKVTIENIQSSTPSPSSPESEPSPSSPAT